jgi:signal transduction histidine kinase
MGPKLSPTHSQTLQSVFDPAPMAVAVVDAHTMTVCYGNAALGAITGKVIDTSSENLLLSDILPVSVAERGASLIREVIRSGQGLARIEAEHHPTPDDDRYLSVSAWMLAPDEEQASCVVLQFEDITDDVRERRVRNAMSEQLREINEHLLIATLREQELTQMAEAANDAKSVFLAMMSHELRTPLTAIIGYEELLADGLSGPITPDQQIALERIRQSANHLLALIEQVLTLTNIELKGETVQVERFTLGQLVRSVAVLISPLASEKRLSFKVEVDGEESIVESDPLRLKQILVSLLGNAVRFTDRGSVALQVTRTKEALMFEVRDTGMGIRPEDLQRIFEPFWQVEQRSTRKVGGSGLGLTVAQRTAKLLGGEIAVESYPGAGSTFILRLPVAA